MVESYTGVCEVQTTPELVDNLYANKSLELDELLTDREFSANEYVILRASESQSALARVDKNKLVLLNGDRKSALGVKPRNKEQRMALDALLNDDIKVIVLTGRAGTGKTLLALAAALDRIEDGMYDRMILTRPMSWVGKYGLGALPGDVDDKFGPYLQNYMCNIEHLVGGQRSVQNMIDQYRMEFVPLQLIRGASWPKAMILADEVQVLTYDDMVALGTRVGEGSKLIIMCDLDQRDENIPKEKTGVYKFINSPLAKQSPIVASVQLIKCERSPVAELFADVFER